MPPKAKSKRFNSMWSIYSNASMKRIEKEKKVQLGGRPQLTTEQRNELFKSFKLFDTKGSGIINDRSMAVALRGLGMDPSEAYIESILKKHSDGKLDFDSIDCRDYFMLMEQEMLKDDSISSKKKDFQLFCNPATGMIDHDRLKDISMELNMDLTDDELKEMLNFADPDHTGSVDIKNFVKILERPSFIS